VRSVLGRDRADGRVAAPVDRGADGDQGDERPALAGRPADRARHHAGPARPAHLQVDVDALAPGADVDRLTLPGEDALLGRGDRVATALVHPPELVPPG